MNFFGQVHINGRCGDMAIAHSSLKKKKKKKTCRVRAPLCWGNERRLTGELDQSYWQIRKWCSGAAELVQKEMVTACSEWCSAHIIPPGRLPGPCPWSNVLPLRIYHDGQQNLKIHWVRIGKGIGMPVQKAKLCKTGQGRRHSIWTEWNNNRLHVGCWL